MSAEQQAEQHRRQELDVSREHPEADRILIEEDHRRGAAPDGVQEIAVPERGVVRGDGLLCHGDDCLDVVRRRGRNPDRADEGGEQQARDDQSNDCSVRQPLQSQQQHAEHCIHVQHVAGPENACMDDAEHEQPEEPPQVDPRRVLRVACLQAPELDGEPDGEQHAEHAVELAGEDDVADSFGAAVPPVRPQALVEAEEQRGVEGRHVHDEDAEQGEAADRVEHLDALAGGKRSSRGPSLFGGHGRYTRSRPGSLSS